MNDMIREDVLKAERNGTLDLDTPPTEPSPRDFLDWLVVEFEHDPITVANPPMFHNSLRDMAQALTHGELIQWLMYPRMEVTGVAALELQSRYEKSGGVL